MALYTTTAYPLVALVEDISLGKIGLPEIQRPFVWPNVNVRNLFDSLYRGYPAVYLERLRQICATTLTNDYWEITLPNRLATSASRSPSRFAYQASLILLGARALYSPLKIADMIDPAVKGSKTAVEQHHLFPRAYLTSIGINELRDINQIANFAVVEWPDNIKISGQSHNSNAAADRIFGCGIAGGRRKQRSGI